MRGADIYIVRFLPIILFFISGNTILELWKGVNNDSFLLLHSESVIYSSALFLISLSNDKYHCVWNRVMYLELIIVPIINYIDNKFCIFPEAESLLYVISLTWIATLVLTTYLAIRHFWKLNKKKICQTN